MPSSSSALLEWSLVSWHLPDSSPQDTSWLASLPVIPRMSPGKTQPPLSGTEGLNLLNVAQVVLSCCGKALDEEEAPGPVEAQHLRKAGRKWGREK